LRVSGIASVSAWRVFSTNGALLVSAKGGESPDMTRLPGGAYLVEIETPDGTRIRRRFLKE